MSLSFTITHDYFGHAHTHADITPSIVVYMVCTINAVNVTEIMARY